MQKGKRYHDCLEGLDCEVVDVGFNEITFLYPGRGKLYRTPDTVTNEIVLGTLVELPDDDHLNDAALYLSNEIYGGFIAAPPRQRCADHQWVNYTPYHDASPRAKFHCKRCDQERD